MPAADALGALDSGAGRSDAGRSASPPRGLRAERAAQPRGPAPGPCWSASCAIRCLLLLLAAAAVSGLTGDPTDAVIIGVIVALSVGLGFVNEYRSEQAVDALHAQIRHTALVVRDGAPQRVDVDRRSCRATSCSCRSATSCRPTCGCSRRPSSSATRRCSPASRCRSTRRADPVAHEQSCALMGTIVREGIGARRGRAHRDADRRSGGSRSGSASDPARPRSRSGCGKFSFLLVRVAGVLTVSIFVINLAAAPAVHRRAAVLARDRDRPHAAAPAGDRDGEPLDRIAAARAQEGAREAAREHRGPRQHHAAVHRQDRHAHRRPHHVRSRRRRRPARRSPRAHLLGLVCNEAVARRRARP